MATTAMAMNWIDKRIKELNYELDAGEQVRRLERVTTVAELPEFLVSKFSTIRWLAEERLKELLNENSS
jgi:hypothetical protein